MVNFQSLVATPKCYPILMKFVSKLIFYYLETEKMVAHTKFLENKDHPNKQS